GQRVEINLVDPADSAAAEAILARHGSSAPERSPDGTGMTVSAQDAPAALQGVLADLDEAGIRLYDAGMRRPTLDEVFLRLTGHTASTAVPTDGDAAGAQKGSDRTDAPDAGSRAVGGSG
ncbi:MAG: daunorubicin/doxorubicin resistance ABC transporter ATP-binding protein DrrA, partial [Glaciihabitans sp.]